MNVRLKIDLTKPNRTYFTGETVYGAVAIHNDSGAELKLLNGLLIVFYGGAATNLKGPLIRNGIRIVPSSSLLHQSRNKYADHQMRGKEFYLNQKVRLTSVDGEEAQAQGWDGRTILPGVSRNIFPFQLDLPLNLISSFRGAHGLISYDISTSIRLITGSLVQTYNSSKCEFKVIATTPIYPSIGEPSVFKFHKEVNPQWGILNASISCSVRQALPGESVHTNICASSTPTSLTGYTYPIRKIRLEFVQEITYKCPVGSFTDCHVRASTACSEWEDHAPVPMSVRLPTNLLPSTITDGDIGALISIDYFLYVRLKMVSQLEQVKMGKIRIVIGTVRHAEFNEANFTSQIVDRSSSFTSQPADERTAPPYALLDNAMAGPPNFRHDSLEDDYENCDSSGGRNDGYDVDDDNWDEAPPPTYAEAMGMEMGAR